jgi:two-component system, chemotaxis family, response regulator PixH
MKKLVVIDDDPKVRSLMRVRLQSAYEVFDTGDPEEAFALVLAKKPDAILLDLLMPGHSGFELCHSMHSFSFTSKIPIFIVTGENGNLFREHCKTLGASGYFEKPVDFPALIRAIESAAPTRRIERRAHLRVAMKVMLKLVVREESNKFKWEIVTTENISAGGFLCACATPLVRDDVVEVYLSGQEERYVGKARVARREVSGAPWQNYGFQFTEKTEAWVLQ